LGLFGLPLVALPAGRFIALSARRFVTATAGRFVASTARSVFAVPAGPVFFPAARLVRASATRPVAASTPGPGITLRRLGLLALPVAPLSSATTTATAAPATARPLFAAGRPHAGLSFAENTKEAGFGLFDNLDLNLVTARAKHQQRFGNCIFDSGASALRLFLFVVVLH